MTSKPLLDVGVFSLSEEILQAENNGRFENWHLSMLSKESTLAELIDALSPWLKKTQLVESVPSNAATNNAQAMQTESPEDLDELIITEVAKVFTDNGNEDAFDFSLYLQHQGTVELALFMLDDYIQENHQQLDNLIEAIKVKNITAAKLSISALTLNAKILSAQELQSLCVKWSKLLSGSETPSSLESVNALLKSTRIALNEIDGYAEAI